VLAYAIDINQTSVLEAATHSALIDQSLLLPFDVSWRGAEEFQGLPLCKAKLPLLVDEPNLRTGALPKQAFQCKSADLVAGPMLWLPRLHLSHSMAPEASCIRPEIPPTP
jgi:hypothetical protein